MLEKVTGIKGIDKFIETLEVFCVTFFHEIESSLYVQTIHESKKNTKATFIFSKSDLLYLSNQFATIGFQENDLNFKIVLT